MKSLLAGFLAVALSLGTSVPKHKFGADDDSNWRMNVITTMNGWEGFVYDLEGCPTQSTMESEFKAMLARGASVVLPTIYCDGQDTESYYSSVLSAASAVDILVIPCIWTLQFTGQTFNGTIVPRIHAWANAINNNPWNVIAVALGDEPLYDWDFGDPDTLAQWLNTLKSIFTSTGQSIPVSISELAYGWQQAGDTTSVQDAVDLYMINNFPYFAQNAQYGNSASSWTNFLNDMSYYESISAGKPLLVTQTGWPSNEDLYAPNSPDIVATLASEEAYWNLLNSHCSDYFAANNVGWMWRAWDDDLDGWGVKYLNQTDKWDWSAQSNR